MTTTDVPSTGTDYGLLARRITAAGLLDRRPGYYAVRTGLLLALGLAAAAAYLSLGDSWAQLWVAAGVAVLSAQLGLLAHDIAHRQVFRTARASGIAGRIVGNLGIGMGYGWWSEKHTRHHANPNHSELDPDVAPDLLVWSEEQARDARGAARVVGRWQAFLFFPLLTFEGVNLHVASILALRRPTMRHRVLEAALLLAHFVGYVAALLLVLSPGRALAFAAVHHAVLGVYLGCTFAPNHKGMPEPAEEHRRDFLRRQVLTSRNVRGGPILDVALGGLNYQIEHHLFPSMPTANLPKAQPIVRAYCAEIGVPYGETGLIDSYAQALRHMHRVGAPLRAGK
ncbi:fatty acid desaturase family protein [Cryptosporangium arvum]|uniref:Fatty acid desaturase n=1 Tax=Cryptosporangium arvum DSM 44712 TaxID=927661 RepID=A0A010YHF6_9ACTN|nr:acyl-CoA desaturase [Cryptosporangium arvum]EXG79705.1 fatty acid desaturase [Cryptosporangium arvum DSM 44712]